MQARNGRVVVLAICSLVVAIHFVVIIPNALNIPFSDDYDAILGFLNAYTGASTLTEKTDLIVTRHNEHRIILGKLITLAQFGIGGEVNFKILTLIGNLFVLFLFILVGRYYSLTQRSWWFFLPAVFIIFNLSSFEAFLWPMVVLQTMGVLFFAFLSIYFLHGNKSLSFNVRILLSFLSGVVATYSCGNGMLILIIGLVSLILVKASLRYLIAWFAATLVVVYYNIKGYEPILGNPQPITTFLEHPDYLVAHFFVLLGDYFFFSFPTIVLAGFALLSLFLYYVVPRATFKTDPLSFYFLCFLILSCAITSLSRAGFGASQAMAHRYHIYSALIVLFLYFCVQQNLDHSKRIVRISFVVFITSVIAIYCISFSRYSKRSKNFSNELKDGIVEYNEKGSHAKLAYPSTEAAFNVLVRAKEKGIYVPPNYSYQDYHASDYDFDLPKETNDIYYSLNLRHYNNLIFFDSCFAFIPGESYNGFKTYLVLQSPNETHILDVRQQNHPAVNKLYSSETRVDNSGFQCVFADDFISDSEYKIGVLLKSLGGQHLEFTNVRLLKKGHLATLKEEGQPVTTVELTGLNAQHYIDAAEFKEGKLYLRGWAVVNGISSEETTIGLKLSSHQSTIHVNVTPEERSDVADVLNGEYKKSGFIFHGQKELSPGVYKIVIVLNRQGSVREIEADSELIVR